MDNNRQHPTSEDLQGEAPNDPLTHPAVIAYIEAFGNWTASKYLDTGRMDAFWIAIPQWIRDQRAKDIANACLKAYPLIGILFPD